MRVRTATVVRIQEIGTPSLVIPLENMVLAVSLGYERVCLIAKAQFEKEFPETPIPSMGRIELEESEGLYEGNLFCITGSDGVVRTLKLFCEEERGEPTHFFTTY